MRDMTRARALLVSTTAGVALLALVSNAGSAERPFTLGPSPVTVTISFADGRGGCAFARSFTDTFQLFAPGNGRLTITQPRTGDVVEGAIRADGTFQLRSDDESYDGKITGSTGTATYAYTSQGCTQTYDATFALPESDLELMLTAPARARMNKHDIDRKRIAIVLYRIVITNNGPSTSPGGTFVLRVSRPMRLASQFFAASSAGLPAASKPVRCAFGRAAVFTCRVPELHRDEVAAVALPMQARLPGAHVARGTVTGVNVDPVLANNRSMRSTTVRR